MYSFKLFFIYLLFFAIYNVKASVIIYPDSISIGNKITQRVLRISNNKLVGTFALRNLLTQNNYCLPNSNEFSFNIDTVKITCSDFKFMGANIDSTNSEVYKLVVELKGERGVIKNLLATLVFKVYEGLPFIYKRLYLHNVSTRNITITNLHTDDLNLEICKTEPLYIYRYGFDKPQVQPFTGNDTAVLLYSIKQSEGLLIGSDVPILLNYIDVYTQLTRVVLGMNNINAPFPFKRILLPGSELEAPSVFLCIINSKTPQQAFLENFTLYKKTRPGNFLFHPSNSLLNFYFTKNNNATITDKIITRIIDSCALAGTNFFVISNGWQLKLGEWEADPKRFKKGLLPVVNYIKQKGLQPGMCIWVCAVDSSSKWVKGCPHWLIRDKNGNFCDFNPTMPSSKNYSMSLGSDWFDETYHAVKKAVRQYNLAYVKLVFNAITPYNNNIFELSGDNSFEYKNYSDFESSFWILNQRTRLFINELHKEFPDLMIDCDEYY